MDKRLKETIHRYTLWKVYNGKCFYCGNFIPTVFDLDEDHIIPQIYKDKPTELEKIIEEYGLRKDFDIDAYYNRVPSHSGCNRRKGFKTHRKETIHYYINLAEEKVEKIKEFEEKNEKKATANEKLFKRGFDRKAIEKFLSLMEEDDQAKQRDNDENLTTTNQSLERPHRDKQKWQEFYDRMANIEPKHLGIDIQHLLNNKIRDSDFESVLKMNVGARDKYLKIYNNREWYFRFLNNRMGGDRYEIFVRDEITQQIYDFFEPSENKDTLIKWLDYIAKYSVDTGIMINRKRIT